MDEVVLVDSKDTCLGFEEKEACHRIPVKLHRAFSIFIVNRKRQMLIQKRSATKKTWPGFWSNACCSHPRKDEDVPQAVSRRLKEELGFTCPLVHIFTFNYEANFNEEFGESEIDHVFIGEYDGLVKPNMDEVDEWKFISLDWLRRDIGDYPGKYTPWFMKALPEVMKYIAGHM